MGFPDMGGRSAIALQSLASPPPPAGYGAAEAILVRPAIKGVSAVNASNEGEARRLIKICSAPVAQDPLAGTA
jgi:hypothetical protein